MNDPLDPEAINKISLRHGPSMEHRVKTLEDIIARFIKENPNPKTRLMPTAPAEEQSECAHGEEIELQAQLQEVTRQYTELVDRKITEDAEKAERFLEVTRKRDAMLRRFQSWYAGCNCRCHEEEK